MHLVIAHAAPTGPNCRAASRSLTLPALQTLLARARAVEMHTANDTDLSPLPERLVAGAHVPDGLVPWAAWKAQVAGLYQSGQAWALITPCHLQVHADHVAMHDPHALQLEEAPSRALWEAMRPYFEEDGIDLHWHSPRTWLAQGPALHNLPTASLARVRGQPIDPWIPRQAQAASLRRLQNEMQMLLYTHPVNDARSAAGRSPVNGFWISGTGTPQSPQGQLLDLLTRSASQDDPKAWATAWQTLDAGPLAQALARHSRSPDEPLCISLCGPSHARSYFVAKPSAWQRLSQLLPARRAATYLDDL